MQIWEKKKKEGSVAAIETCAGKLTGQTKIGFKHYYSSNFMAA